MNYIFNVSWVFHWVENLSMTFGCLCCSQFENASLIFNIISQTSSVILYICVLCFSLFETHKCLPMPLKDYFKCWKVSRAIDSKASHLPKKIRRHFPRTSTTPDDLMSLSKFVSLERKNGFTTKVLWHPIVFQIYMFSTLVWVEKSSQINTSPLLKLCLLGVLMLA